MRNALRMHKRMIQFFSLEKQKTQEVVDSLEDTCIPDLVNTKVRLQPHPGFIRVWRWRVGRGREGVCTRKHCWPRLTLPEPHEKSSLEGTVGVTVLLTYSSHWVRFACERNVRAT